MTPKRNTLLLRGFLLLVALLLVIPVASARIQWNSEFPFISWSDISASEWAELPVELQRLYSQDIVDRTGSMVDDATATDVLNAVYETTSGTVDTGVDASQGITLDWVEESLTRRCLGVDLSKNPIFSQDVQFVVKDTTFDLSRVSTSLEVRGSEDRTQTVISKSCSSTSSRLSNGSTDVQENCVNTSTKETETVTTWTPVTLTSYGADSAHYDEFTHTDPAYYKYCIDTPIEAESYGWGTKSTVYVVYGTTAYMDLQHSSYWNLTFPYRRPISIQNNDASNVLKKWHTIEVSGWDTTDTTRFNATLSDNFEVACHNEAQTDVVVDTVIGNNTELLSDSLTKRYPDSTGWFTTNTTFLFKLPQNISSSSTNATMCYIYYGILDFRSNNNNLSEIALFWDQFDRADSTTLGRNWIESAAGVQIQANAWDIDANNGVARTPLDVGNCTDCDRYEIDYMYDRGAAVGGSGACIGFHGGSGAGVSDCPSSGTLGIVLDMTDESSIQGVEESSGGVRSKESALTISNRVNFTLRTIALDDVNRGDYISYRNNSYVSWGTTNLTDTGNGLKWGIHTMGNRADNRIYYILVKRWIDTAPTITVGAEAANSTKSNNVPTHNLPLVNVSNTFNTTFGNVTAWNLTTADTDNESVKNIYWWRYNNTELSLVTMPFEGGSNDTFTRDYTTPSNNGTVLGAKFINQTGSGGYDGFGAYVFDGINDQVAFDDKFDQTTATQPFYLSAWVYTNTTTGTHEILFRYGDVGIDQNRIVLRQSGTDLQFVISNASGASTITATANLSSNTWTHVAGRFNGSAMALFVNGVERASQGRANYRLDNVSTNDWAVGGNPNDATTNPFNGTIDEVVVIFNYTITNNQVQLWYQNATNTTHSDLTERNQTWSGYVTPNDRRGDGQARYGNVTINRLPEITAWSLNSTNPQNYTNGTVILNLSYFTVTDADGNSPITNRTTWYRNTSMLATWDNFTSIVNASANFSRGYNLTVVMSAFDGAEYGLNATATIIIRNAPPDLSSINISNSSVLDTTANLTGQLAFTDIDGDSITDNSSRWFENGTEQSWNRNRTLYNASNTTRLYSYIFSAQAFDGTNWSDWFNSSTRVIENSVPTRPNRVPFSNISIYEIAYGVNCSGSTDGDGDTINYEFWLGNLSAGDYQLRQNTTATNYTFTFGANYTASFNCRANDAINVSGFNSTNVTIEFNNSVSSQELLTHSAERQSGANISFTLNVSYNGIRVRDLLVNLSISGANHTATETNGTSNTSLFDVNLFIPFESLAGRNVSFFWYIRADDWNGSTTYMRRGGYMNLTALRLFADGCNGVTNSSQWTIWNLTIGNEVNETAINASIEASIFLYTLGTGRENNGSFNIDLASVNQTFVCLATNSTTPYAAYGIFHYAATLYDARQYYLINDTVDNITDNIRFYLLLTGEATGISMLVQDETEKVLPQRYIIVERYDAGNNSYKTVAMGKTDDAGLDYIFLRRFDVFYRFRIQNDVNTIFLSTPRKVTTTSLIFTITTGTVFDQLTATEGVNYNLSYNNATNTFQVIFVHTDTKVTSSCLEVWQFSIKNSTSRICNTCINQSAGTLTCDVGNTTSGTFTGTYYVRTSGLDRTISTLEFSRNILSSFTSLLGRSGLLLTVVLVGTIAFAGLWSPTVSVILFMVGLFAVWLLGLLNISLAALLTLAVMAGFLISKVKK